MKQIEVARDVRAENARLSEALHRKFSGAGLRVVGLLGSPGSGKTTLLENILPALLSKIPVAVIEGDVATDHDARRIAALGVQAAQINTNGACHLDAAMVEKALSGIDTKACRLLFIENVGNLVCPVAFPVGEDIRIAVISAAEGEDKPQKYPSAILHTEALVITKTDLAPLVRVDPFRMAKYARAINPRIRVFFSRFDTDGRYACVGESNENFEDYLVG